MPLNNHLIIIADLGELKAYKVNVVKGFNPQDTMQVAHTRHRGTEAESTVLTLACEADYIEPHKHVSDTMSDKEGRKGHAAGEPHNRTREEERRALKNIAEDIAKIVADEKPKTWHLAFPKEHLNALVDMIDTETKKSMGKTVAKDLTDAHVKELPSHFE